MAWKPSLFKSMNCQKWKGGKESECYCAMINKNRIKFEQVVYVILGCALVCGGGCVKMLWVYVLEVTVLWADMVDSWIPSSGLDRFTPSEEHRMLLPVTISLPQIHISCCFIRSGNNLGGLWWWCLKWGGLTPECPWSSLQERLWRYRGMATIISSVWALMFTQNR